MRRWGWWIWEKGRRTARRSAPWKSRLMGNPVNRAGAAGAACGEGAGEAGTGGAWDACAWGAGAAGGGCVAAWAITTGVAAGSSKTTVSAVPSGALSTRYGVRRVKSITTLVTSGEAGFRPMRTRSTGPWPTWVAPGTAEGAVGAPRPGRRAPAGWRSPGRRR